MIYKDAAGLVGHTPLLDLTGFEAGMQARLLAKLERFNPAGSVKDRIGAAMIEQAEADGLLGPGSVIIEPTSGNTGIGLACTGIPKGYRVVLTMPDTMSEERRSLLKSFGAELVLTEGAKGMAGAIEKAAQLAGEIPGSFIPGQFENPANPAAHEKTTGPEIWRDTGGTVDCFVAGVGTGGTITGTGRYLRANNPDVTLVAVEPAASPVLSGGKAGPHRIQGIGAGFVPKALDASLLDDIIQVTDADAFATAKSLARKCGVLCGVSSGAALWAALKLARTSRFDGGTIVVLLPDTGERYLSMGLFD